MIKVEHVQASITPNGDRIDTLILEYPRVIHSQLLTHRVFSKNSSSTRAIPLEKAIEQLKANPAEYIWTENQSGMQGKVIQPKNNKKRLKSINDFHTAAMWNAIQAARKLAESPLKVHKQNAGRYLEPFQNIRIVLTSTEWENWDWLRMDEHAQPEIHELACKIKQARDEAEPMLLKEGEWHVPFIERYRCPEYDNLIYSLDDEDQTELNVEEALKVSASVCAQTSYRNADYSLEKAKDMYEKLTGSDHIHASPFEHIATPIGTSWIQPFEQNPWCNAPEGVTHVDRNYNYWSGNLKGFIQYRQLIPNHDHAKS